MFQGAIWEAAAIPARRVAEVRELLIARTRDVMIERLRLGGGGELTSILQLIESQLHSSVVRLLTLASGARWLCAISAIPMTRIQYSRVIESGRMVSVGPPRLRRNLDRSRH